MNLRWRDPAAVMHRDFVIFNSNSTITAKFELDIITISEKSVAVSYGDRDLYLEADTPVPTAVTSTIEISERRYEYNDNTGEDELVYDDCFTETMTIPAGSTKSNVFTFTDETYSGYTQICYKIISKSHTWNGNGKYKLGTTAW